MRLGLIEFVCSFRSTARSQRHRGGITGRAGIQTTIQDTHIDFFPNKGTCQGTVVVPVHDIEEAMTADPKACRLPLHAIVDILIWISEMNYIPGLHNQAFRN